MKKLVTMVLVIAMFAMMMPAAFALNENGYDLQGNTVIIRLWDNVNPYAEDVSDVDKAAWLPVYEAIKEAYNCNFEFYTSTSEWDDMPAEWIQSVAGGDPAWHITNNLSSMWAMNLGVNGALADISAGLEELDMPQLFKDAGMVGEARYGFITGFPGPEGLVFNRQMIYDAGMEYDPGEMFAMGKWDYESFYNYMVELQSKLPEGHYAFFIDPNYWGIFAPPANGGQMAVHSDFTVGITSDEYIESFELLEKLIAAGCVRPANVTDSGDPDYWGTPAATFDAGVEVAMTHRAGWQMGGLNNTLSSWGYVPYPWGSGATLTVEGDYTSLENYYGTYYDLGLTGAVLEGIEVDFPGLEVEYVEKALVNLIYDLLWTEEAKAEIKAMADPDFVLEPESQFSDELSAELHTWVKQHTKFNPIANLQNAGLGKSYGGEVSLYGLTRKPFNDGTSVRSTFEAAIPEIEASFRDAGYLK